MEDVCSGPISKPSAKRLPLRCLNHISRVVKDLDRSAAFYCMLGFVRIKRPELPCQGVWLWSDDYAIGVHLLKGNPPARSSTINPTSDHLSFEAESTSHVEACLQQLGIEYVTALVEEDGMLVTQLFFHDPDNNMIEVCNCDLLPIVPLSSGNSCSSCFATAAQQHMSLLSQLSQQQQQQQQEADEQEQGGGSQCSVQSEQQWAESGGLSGSDDSMGLPAPLHIAHTSSSVIAASGDSAMLGGGSAAASSGMDSSCGDGVAGSLGDDSAVPAFHRQRQASAGRSDSCEDNLGHVTFAGNPGLTLALSSAFYGIAKQASGPSTNGSASGMDQVTRPAAGYALHSPFHSKDTSAAAFVVTAPAFAAFAAASAARPSLARPAASSPAFPPSKHQRVASAVSDHSDCDSLDSGGDVHVMEVDSQAQLPVQQRVRRSSSSMNQEEITHFMLASLGPCRSAPVWV